MEGLTPTDYMWDEPSARCGIGHKWFVFCENFGEFIQKNILGKKLLSSAVNDHLCLEITENYLTWRKGPPLETEGMKWVCPKWNVLLDFLGFLFYSPLAGGVESFGNIRKTGPCFSEPPPWRVGSKIWEIFQSLD